MPDIIKMELKTKFMVYILEPIAKYVSYLDDLSSSQDTINRRLILKNELSQKIDDVYYCILLESDKDLDPFAETLRLAFNEFQRTVDFKQGQMSDVNVFNKLLLSIYKLLVKKDSLEIANISSAITNCHNSLMTLEEATTGEEIRVHLKSFSQMTEVCMNHLMDRVRELVSKKQRQLILLCTNQISKCLPCLLSVLKQELEYSPNIPKLLKSYIVNRIAWCFSELLNVIHAPKPSAIEENEGCGGQFVLRMDLALELLTSTNKMPPDVELKPVVDDVLCHAMSIAQVAVASDRKVIMASCQKVLRSLEELKKEYSCSAVNPSFCNLYASSLADSLEALEQRVNTALLRLVLEVFCDSFSPLKNLLEGCRMNTLEVERHTQDLEDLIAVFDLQMDRIMQIGLFAMACSEDVKRVLGIRSCLASLESLEPELIPALTAYYLEPNQTSCVNYLKSLVLLWKSEVHELQKLIDGIIDPAAFCQVTIDDIHLLVTNVKSKLHKADALVLKQMIVAINKRSKKLLQHLKISHDDVEPQRISPDLVKILSDLQFACSECDAAVRLLLPEESEHVDFTARTRLLKRCELILTVMKKLHILLVEMANSTEMKNTSTSIQNVSTAKEQDELLFPENVSGLPVDENSFLSLSEDGDAIAHLVQKGKLLIRERSILYFTPKSKAHLTPALKPASIHRTPCILFSRPDRPEFVESDVVDLTLSLEITSILDKLTSLSNTLTSERSVDNMAVVNESFNSTQTQTIQMLTDNVHDTEMKNVLFDVVSTTSINQCTIGTADSVSMESACKNLFTSTSASSLTSHEVNTPQRMEDLKKVQEKIAALKINLM